MNAFFDGLSKARQTVFRLVLVGLCLLGISQIVFAAHGQPTDTSQDLLEEIAALEAHVKTYPDDINYQVLLAKRYQQNAEFDKAHSTFSHVLTLDKAHDAALLGLQQLNAIKKSLMQLKEANMHNPYDQPAATKSLLTLAANDEFELLDILLDLVFDNDFHLNNQLNRTYVESLLRRQQPKKAYAFLQSLNVQEGRLLFDLRAAACAAQGMFDCAEPLLRTQWKKSQAYADGIALADILIKQRKLVDAYQLLETLSTHSDKDSTSFNLAQTSLIQTINDEHAQRQSAFDNNPSAENAMSLATLLYNTGQQQSGISQLQNYLTSQPKDDTTRFELMRFYAWSSRYPEAIITYRALTNPTEEASLLYSQVLAWKGDVDEAETAIKSLIFSSDLNIRGRAQFLLGNIYIWQNNPTRALEILEPLQRSPTPGLNLHAVDESIRRAHGHSAPVIASPAQPTESTPAANDNSQMILAQAYKHQELKQYSDAIKSFQEYLALHPNDLAAHQQLGLAYITTKNFDKGLKHLSKYAYQTFTAESLAELGRHYVWTNNLEQAARAIRVGLEQYPSNAELLALNNQINQSNTRLEDTSSPSDKALFVRATELYENGNFKQAKPMLQDYLSRNPRNLIARVRYADSLNFTGDHDRAAAEYYFLTQTPLSTPRIQFQYGYNLSRSGNYVAAQKVLVPLNQSFEDEANDTQVPVQVAAFLDQWLTDWQSREFLKYADNYDDVIKLDAKWRQHKLGVFARTSHISVEASNIHIVSSKVTDLNKHSYIVEFFQVYDTPTLKDKGYKTLHLHCTMQMCKIHKETWSDTQQVPLRPVIERTPENLQQRKELRQLIQQELEYINREARIPQGADSLVKGINFGRGIKKILSPEREVLTEAHAQAVTVLAPESVFLTQDKLTPIADERSIPHIQERGLSINTAFSNDEDQHSIRAFYHWPNGEYFYKVAGGPVYFEDDGCSELGLRTRTSIYRDAWSLGANIGLVNDDAYALPRASYNLKSGHVLDLDADKFFYDTSNCDTLALGLNRYKVELSSYEELDQESRIWYSLAGAYITDDNTRATGQFWYQFGDKYWHELNYKTSLNGWYVANSLQSDDYFSPDFYDSTYVALDLEHPWTENAHFFGRTHAGVSLSETQLFYLVRAGLNYTVSTDAQFKASCEASQSTSNDASGENQIDQGCQAGLEVRW